MGAIQNYWRFADVAYDEPTGKEFQFSRCTNFLAMQNDMDYAYWAEFSHEVIVGFRGTDTKEKGIRGTKAWLSNIDAYPLRELERAARMGRNPELLLRESGLLRDGHWGQGSVHDGFYKLWSYFKPAIDSCLKNVPKNKPIMFTGHSRGGAPAEIGARHAAKNRGLTKVKCITYGSPAVGTKAYRDEFRLLPIHATYVVNGYDIVTTLPPRALGFRHGGTRKWLSQPWWHRFAHRIRDHLPKNYKKRLLKAVKAA